MKRIALALIAAAVATTAFTAAAEERRKVNPLAIQGMWLGTTGALPTSCDVAGYKIAFGTNNGETWLMTVQEKVIPKPGETPVLPKVYETNYKVMEPPATAPVRLEIFLAGDKGNVGIDHVGGSTLEIVPAGPDGTYPQTSLYLRRCS